VKAAGMPRLLLASLLLHLALLLAAGYFLPKRAAVTPPLQPLVVDQLFSQAPEKVAARLDAKAQIPKAAEGKKGKAAPKDETLKPLPEPPRRPVTAIGVQRFEPAERKPEQSITKPAASAVMAPVGEIADKAPAPASAVGQRSGVTAAGSLFAASKGDSGLGAARSAGSVSSEAAGHRKEAYQVTLKRLIEAHKEYPLASRRKKEQGSCERRFVLSRNGNLKQVEALTHCDHPFLDDAATRAIVSVGKFPPLPEEFEGSEASFSIKISFNLTKK
jgi:periplasmic protein TonB